MIQRVQTIFLTLAAAAILTMFFYPVSSITEFTTLKTETLETDYYHLFLTGFNDPSADSKPQMSAWTFVPILVLTIMLLVLIIYSIFRFKNRFHQLKMVKLSIFLNILLVAGIFLNYHKFFTSVPTMIETGVGAYFLLVTLVLLVVSHRFILKDEKLIRSADRLR